MAEKLTTAIDIKVGVSGDASVKSIKQELREAVNEAANLAAKFGDASPQATEAAKRVANLRDRMEDLNNRVKALNPDKFQRFATFASGIASGFSAAQGAMALFGAESEDVQKQLARVQGAMAFAQGIQGIEDMQKAFTGAGAKVLDFVKKLGVLKTALLATGIGAVVWAFTELSQALEVTSKKHFEAEKAVRDHAREMEQLNAELNKEVGLIDDETYALQLNEIERKKRIDDIQSENIQKAIEKNTSVFSFAYWKNYFKNLGNPAMAAVDAATDGIEQGLRESQKAVDAINEEADKKAEIIKAREERKRKEAAAKQAENTAKVIETVKRDDELIGTVRQQGYDKLEAQQKEFEFKRLTLFDESATERLNREAEEYERSLKQQQDASNARISLANATASALMSINDIMAKSGAEATNFAKAITLLQIGIDTASAISSLNAESAKVAARMAAVTGPATPAFTAAYYAQGIARILANVAQAKKVLSGGGAGVQAPVASTMQAPQAREFTAFGLPSDRVEQAGGAGAMRVYVVDSDITRQQKRSRAIQRTSVI